MLVGNLCNLFCLTYVVTTVCLFVLFTKAAIVFVAENHEELNVILEKSCRSKASRQHLKSHEFTFLFLCPSVIRNLFILE